MEKYINDRTIVKNDIFKSIKDEIICPKCKFIILEPYYCIDCENNFCKNCTDQKNGKCPMGCEGENLKLKKKNPLVKLRFKCIKGCGAEIKYNDINNHYDSDCLNNKQANIKFLSKNEMEKIKKEKISYIKSK